MANQIKYLSGDNLLRIQKLFKDVKLVNNRVLNKEAMYAEFKYRYNLVFKEVHIPKKTTYMVRIKGTSRWLQSQSFEKFMEKVFKIIDLSERKVNGPREISGQHKVSELFVEPKWHLPDKYKTTHSQLE